MDPRVEFDKIIDTLIKVHLSLSRWKSEISFLMDVYVLLRLFTKFEKGKRKGPQMCETEDMNNVIIYTGATHSETYKLFFELYGNYEPYISVLKNAGHKDSHQCLEFEKPFDFFG